MDFDELKDKALNLANEHQSEVDQGIDKAADLVKDKVGHDDQVEEAADKLKGFIGN